MADLVYLSLSLRDFRPDTMLRYWQTVLEAFPASESQRLKSLSIHPFDWSETPVLERTFGEEATPADAAALASEFLHDDYAYEAEMTWDLWVPEESGVPRKAGETDAEELETDFPDSEGVSEESEDEELPSGMGPAGWRRAPVVVSIACLGPGFEQDVHADRADIQIKFGLDSPFLPIEEDVLFESEQDLELADLRTRENLQQLVSFVHELDEALPVEKRLLWCDSGENLAEKILDAWNERI